MAITAEVKGIKVVLDLEKGSQTIANCNQSATDEALYEIGSAVATLQSENVSSVNKVVETILINA